MSISFARWNLQIVTQAADTHTTTVYVIPWETWVPLLIIILFFIALLLRTRKTSEPDENQS